MKLVSISEQSNEFATTDRNAGLYDLWSAALNPTENDVALYRTLHR